MELEDFVDLPRIEQANHMLENFCESHLNDGDDMYSDRWYTNIKLIKMYAEEVEQLMKKHYRGNNND